MELPREEGLAEAVSSADLVLGEDEAEDKQALLRRGTFEAGYPSSEYLDGRGCPFAAAGLLASSVVPSLRLYRRDLMEEADDVAEQDGHWVEGYGGMEGKLRDQEGSKKEAYAVQGEGVKEGRREGRQDLRTRPSLRVEPSRSGLSRDLQRVVVSEGAVAAGIHPSTYPSTLPLRAEQPHIRANPYT